eukprot:4378880-Prymnesium_polylepis.1
MTLQAPWIEQVGNRGGNLSHLLRHIGSQRLRIDKAQLRNHYSEELLALLLALTAKDAAARPTMRALLEWPIFAKEGGAKDAAPPRPKVRGDARAHKRMHKGTQREALEAHSARSRPRTDAQRSRSPVSLAAEPRRGRPRAARRRRGHPIELP